MRHWTRAQVLPCSGAAVAAAAWRAMRRRQCSAVAKELCKQLRQSGAITMHAPIGVVLPGQGAGRAAPS